MDFFLSEVRSRRAWGAGDKKPLGLYSLTHFRIENQIVVMLHTHSLSRRLRCVLLLMVCTGGLVVPGTAHAQEDERPEDETLVGNVQSSGGYGAPTVAVTSVHGETAALIGGQGGWILGRQFVIGGAVRGIAPRPSVELRDESDNLPASAQLQLGYGGLLIEYIGRPSRLLHYGAEAVVGAGTVELVEGGGFRAGASVSDESLDRSAVFAAELGARAELNVTRFFRVGLSGGYRFVTGGALQRADVSDGDLSAPYGQLSLRFGRF